MKVFFENNSIYPIFWRIDPSKILIKQILQKYLSNKSFKNTYQFVFVIDEKQEINIKCYFKTGKHTTTRFFIYA